MIFQEFQFDLLIGHRILLTSDGVHDVITKKEFRDLSITSEKIEDFGEKIVKLLKAKILTDNTSFIAISVV